MRAPEEPTCRTTGDRRAQPAESRRPAGGAASAENTNRLWLTNVAQFTVANFKCYLSVIVDCFDGKVVFHRHNKTKNPRICEGHWLGCLDSNQEWLNQNQLCCQLHHIPIWLAWQLRKVVRRTPNRI
jgi:hypothetical protein